jgi:hypothetical protein
MIGRVRRVHKMACIVQWDDVEVREVNFEHVALHGDTLRAAETQNTHLKQANMENSGGGTRRSIWSVPSKPATLEPSEVDDDSDNDEPLDRLRP